MSLLSITLTLFLIMNSVGHINGFLYLVKELDHKRQQKIIIREMFIALVVMFAFHYVGEWLLLILDVQPSTARVAVGIILFLMAIKMVFPSGELDTESLEKDEPFIVPMAVPMIAGPSVLITIILYAHDESSPYLILLAILIAWAVSVVILAFSPVIRRIMGNKALLAVERLMGLILTLMAVEMLLKGIQLFIADGKFV